jgi:hypothetical protein
LDALDVLERVTGKENMYTYIEPMIQIIEAIWIEILREYLSARKDDESAPTREPNGIAAVIAPCP